MRPDWQSIQELEARIERLEREKAVLVFLMSEGTKRMS